MLATRVLEPCSSYTVGEAITPAGVQGSVAIRPEPTRPQRETAADLRGWLQGFASELGFYGARYVHLGHAVAGGSGAPVRFLSTSTRDAADRNARDWLARDPAAARVRDGAVPFAWSTRAEAGWSTVQRHWIEAERAHGVRAGLAVPVQDHAAGPGYLSLFGVDEGDIARLLAERAPALSFAATHFHARAKAVLPAVADKEAGGELTQREIQCLELAARGWTVPASADLLTIAARTVEFHLANAAMKLRAANKVHAVALAASARLILV
jgi:LuxR family transcriptional regulator, activator of conjugal transfer of Ti plasmids